MKGHDHDGAADDSQHHPDDAGEPDAPEPDGIRARALSIGIAVGAYAISFGAVSVAAGLDVLQTQALSALMFTGASQFAFIGVVAAGGGLAAAALTAWLLGLRNGLYALHLAGLFTARQGSRGPRRWLETVPPAHFTIDESTAMAVAYEPDRRSRDGRSGRRGCRCSSCGTSEPFSVRWAPLPSATLPFSDSMRRSRPGSWPCSGLV